MIVFTLLCFGGFGVAQLPGCQQWSDPDGYRQTRPDPVKTEFVYNTNQGVLLMKGLSRDIMVSNLQTDILLYSLFQGVKVSAPDGSQSNCLIYAYIYIYYPLYTNWPITNADLPHVIIQYILYFICQNLYWTVSGQLSNIGYIGQFQNEATGTLRTRYWRTKAVSIDLMKILSIFLHLWKILICFRIDCFL